MKPIMSFLLLPFHFLILLFQRRHLEVISRLTACILLSLTLPSHIVFSPISPNPQSLFLFFSVSFFHFLFIFHFSSLKGGCLIKKRYILC